jgi:hypothetical protein
VRSSVETLIQGNSGKKMLSATGNASDCQKEKKLQELKKLRELKELRLKSLQETLLEKEKVILTCFPSLLPRYTRSHVLVVTNRF